MRTAVERSSSRATSRKRALLPKARKSRRLSGSKHQATDDPRAQFSEDEWHEMVATAAYYRAEVRGFDGGSPEDDWYEAEAELTEQLTKAQGETDPISSFGGNTADMEREGE